MSAIPEQAPLLEIFYAYAQQDLPLHEELQVYLSMLLRQNLIAGWYHYNITTKKGSLPGLLGTPPSQAVGQGSQYQRTKIVLLLISADFLASDFCYSPELTRLLAQHDAGEIRLIPILARPVSRKEALFSNLPVLPANGIPIASKHWQSRDQAWTNVITELRKLIVEMTQPEPVEATSAASSTFWYVPYQRNPFFTGREDVLSQLRAHFMDSAARSTTTALRPLALIGPNGLGKTQIALEYAYRYRRTYRCMLWINASSVEAVHASFLKIASILQPLQEDLSPQKTIALVYAWLSQQNDWLLIFDGADRLETVSAYLPGSAMGRGHILLTTHIRSAGSLARMIEVEPLKGDDAALLLLRRAALLPAREPLSYVSQQRKSEAEAIVDVLCGLPLALDLAGAYIKETARGLPDYLQLYEKRNQDLFTAQGRPSTGFFAAVATTCSLSLQYIAHVNPAIAEMLQFCAFLAPDAIPEALVATGLSLSRMTRSLPTPAAMLDAVKNLAHSQAEQRAVEFGLEQALAALRRFALLQQDSDFKQFSIHRLIQAALKDEIPAEMKRVWVGRVVFVLDRTFPEVESNWLACQPYLLQVHACARLVNYYRVPSFEAARLLNNTALALKARASYTEAELLCQQALAVTESVMGSEHFSTAVTLNNLAGIYHVQGKYDQAEGLYWRALAIWERELGPDDPSILVGCENLVMLYQAQGKYEQAISFCRRALAIDERTLGPDHPDTLNTLNTLANLYHAQGKYEQAEPLYQQLIVLREQTLGPNHPETASGLNTLALLYRNQGHNDLAEPLLYEALSIRKEVLGPEHPDTASSLSDLANLYRDQGKYEPARQLLYQALAIWEKVLGPEHSQVALTLFHLAQCYIAQSMYDEAEPLFQRIVSIDEHAFGREDPVVATDLEGYAYILQQLQRHEQARSLKARAHAIRAKQRFQQTSRSS